MPHLKELYAANKKKGLEIIGLHTENSSEKMADYVKENGIPWPVAVDREAKTQKAMHADSFPDYYVIDRAGKLRFADLANAELDKVVAMLLKEKAPKVETK